MRSLFASFLFASAAFSASAPVREVRSECPAISGQPICQFRNGYLFRFSASFDPVMRVYAPDGHFALNIPIRIPDAASAWAYDVGVDSDGSFVVAAGGSLDGGYVVKRHAILMFDPNGTQTAFIDTKNFWPNHLAIAEDHAIWVLGSQSEHGDYAILRQYAHDGQLIGSYLARSTFPEGLSPGGPGVPYSVMVASNRIVVVAASGETGDLRELIELNASGNVTGRMRLDGPSSQFALTTNGHLYQHRNSDRNGMVLLDVATRSSKSLGLPTRYGYLIGGDGGNLVWMTTGSDGGTDLAWFDPSTSSQ